MSELALRQAPDFTDTQLQLIKETVAKGATDNELKLFLYRCKNLGLDPLKPGMVHFVKYGTSPGTIVVGIEGFRSKAARTGQLSGIKRGVLRDANGKCVGGWCEVYRKDWQHPAREEVALSEYNTGKSMWAKMPETMIKKVAEAAALRMAFPDDLGGVYSEEEITDSTREVRAQQIQAKLDSEEIEIEIEPDFVTEAAQAMPGLGDYVINVGKKYKGKKLKEVSPRDLESYANWIKGLEKPDAEVVSCREKILQYLEEAK